jgi:hypothetical protein
MLTNFDVNQYLIWFNYEIFFILEFTSNWSISFN